MTCFTEQDLNAFHDGELTASRTTEIAQHLKTCAVCVTQLERLRAITQTLREAPMPVPSLAAQSRWLNAVSVSSDRSVRRFAGWMTVAASIVLAVTMFMSQSQTAQATPTLSDWEATAIGGPDVAGDTSGATAQLIALDLSLPSQNEGVR